MSFVGTKKKVTGSKITQTVVPMKGTQTVIPMKGTQNPKGKVMTMADIRQKAISQGIQPGQMDKLELIHSIQRAEGNSSCFGTSNGLCSYTDCCFMTDCLEFLKSA